MFLLQLAKANLGVRLRQDKICLLRVSQLDLNLLETEMPMQVMVIQEATRVEAEDEAVQVEMWGRRSSVVFVIPRTFNL